MSVFQVILGQIRENADQNNSEYGYFSGSVFGGNLAKILDDWKSIFFLPCFYFATDALPN